MNAPLKKWLKRIGTAFAVLVAVLVAFATWLLATESGARFALRRVASALDGKLVIAQMRGTLAGHLELRDVAYKDASIGIDAKLKSVALVYDFAPLLRKSLHVRRLDIDGVQVALTTVPSPSRPPSSTTPVPTMQAMLTPPLDIVLDKLHVGTTTLTQDGKVAFASDGLDVAASWSHSALVVRQFALRASAGKVQLTGTLDSYRDLRGKARLDFDWQAGHHHYAGVLDMDHDGARGIAHGDIAIDAYTARIDALQFALAAGKFTVDKLVLKSPQIPGSLQATASAQLDAQPITGDAILAWNDVELPAELAGQALATHGRLEASGNAQAFAAKGELSIGPPGQLADIAVQLSGTPDKIALQQLELKQANGGLNASGDIILEPQLGWNILAQARRFDPGAFAKGWPGAVDFALSTNGQMHKDGPAGTLTLDKLGGTLRGRALGGGGELRFAAPATLDGTLRLQSASSTVVLHGKGDKRTEFTADFNVAALGDWLPQAGGRLRGTLAAHGVWPALDARANVDAADIRFADTHIAALALDLDVRDASAPSGRVALNAKHVSTGGHRFDSVTFDAHGKRTAHALTFAATGPQLQASLAIDGALAKNDDWQGALSALRITLSNAPAWTLQHPVMLGAPHEGGFSMDDLCLVSATASICSSANQDKAGALRAKLAIAHLPLAGIARLVAPDAPLRLAGEIDGAGELTRTANGTLGGNAKFVSAAGSVAYPDAATQPILAYESLDASAAFDARGSRIDVHANLSDNGHLDGHVALGANSAGAMPLSGTIAATINNFGFVDLLNTQTANTRGKLDATLTLGGTSLAPDVTGNVAITQFGTEIPAAGLKLHEGRVTLQSSDGRRFALDGQLHSGDGQLAIAGNIGSTADDPIALTISGSDFLAADIPGAQLRISPELALARAAGAFTLTGTLTIPKASIDLSKLPGGGATQPSPDVVIVDARPAPTAAPTPLDADITVKLGAGDKHELDLRQGREVHLVGFGLNGYLGGQLTVRERSGRAATGRGQVVVNGTYKAYGQDLSIDEGRLLFAGTPLDNPGLDLRATRGIPDAQVTVGLQVRGTAQAPQLTVFSAPAMEQSDALSYLVAGKPLSQLKGGEGNAVSSAASALGTAGGDLLAKSIGAKLGFDDVGVADNSAVGGAALTIGKYLSPRLYLSYGIGLFTPGQVVTLRYRLTRHIDTQLQNGTLSSRAGINYRIEK